LVLFDEREVFLLSFLSVFIYIPERVQKTARKNYKLLLLLLPKPINFSTKTQLSVSG
jgi:hypothetical protein